MKVKLVSEIDCEGLPIICSVEAEVPSGSDPLDVVLYDAMSAACRLLANAAREDQRRDHGVRADT